MDKKLIFQKINPGCCCQFKGYKPEKCLCGHDEAVIRAYINGDVANPMTTDQRVYCIDTADWAGEGYYDRKELEVMNDRDLAKALMNAWYMYAQSQY